eukprot:365910-Chlamydomonas_euryale.AAC.40
MQVGHGGKRQAEASVSVRGRKGGGQDYEMHIPGTPAAFASSEWAVEGTQALSKPGAGRPITTEPAR